MFWIHQAFLQLPILSSGHLSAVGFCPEKHEIFPLFLFLLDTCQIRMMESLRLKPRLNEKPHPHRLRPTATSHILLIFLILGLLTSDLRVRSRRTFSPRYFCAAIVAAESAGLAPPGCSNNPSALAIPHS